MPFTFDNSYARLPKQFYSAQAPTPVAAPALVKLNRTLAAEIGVDADVLDTSEGIEMLAGNRLAEGSTPIATAYAGHQFGGWNPQLGDGRAVLLGEVVGADGIRRDIQLKGSGPTMFSRNGDGRATLGAVLREYLVSEAMAALGLPTTRALAAVTTGEQILRDGHEPGAVLTRVAQSHIRVGTFQFHYSRKDTDALRLLADHVIARHYPEATDTGNPVRAMLEGVVARQAELVARWMHFGFIHGVMNTDNCAISGETIDYGPCAFIDVFHPETVFSSIDRQGRYAWNNQPNIAHWNLSQFAQTLIPLLSDDEDAATKIAQEVLNLFPEIFAKAFYAGFARKLGILGDSMEVRKLITDLFSVMTDGEVDFTLFFRHLTSSVTSSEYATVRMMFKDSTAFDAWLMRLEDLAGADTEARVAAMRQANPIYIPRNHRIEEVIAAANNGDLGPFERLHEVLSTPFDKRPEGTEYENAPRPNEVVQATFCGT